MTFTAIIPARWESSRFPGKPLVDIHGVPMIVRTAQRTLLAKNVHDVVVATDDRRIAEVCHSYNVASVMTASEHLTGTDRVVEASRLLSVQNVVNVQGDEPLIEPETIDAVIQGVENDTLAMVSNAACPLTGEDADNPNVVKVVVSQKKRVMYISRHCVPYSWGQSIERLRHMGLYAFKGDALEKYAAYKPGPIETQERIEMFRFLENEDPIALVQVPPSPPAVDTPEDITRVQDFVMKTGGWERYSVDNKT